MNDKLWDNLYWTAELTRPDHLAKILNTIVRKEGGNSEGFIYDRQAAKDAMKSDLTQNDVSQNDVTRHDITGVDLSGHSIDRADFHQHDINQLNSLNNHGSRVHLTHHGKQRFGQLDKLFDSHSRSSSSSNSQSYGDDGNIGFGFLNIFSFGGGFNSQTQTQAASSDSPIVTMTTFLFLHAFLVIPNIPWYAKWTRNVVTVAGGNGNNDATNQRHVPQGLFVDDDQTLVIADTDNYRIVQWKMGDTKGQLLAGGRGRGNRLDQLDHPVDVLSDKETNSLIICDHRIRRVVRWSRRSGTTQGEILIDNTTCRGLAMDNYGYLYVSDAEKMEVR
ncbi:unnamed protein product [Rotaria magnacalcarata]|nr:unnamed protein product [Rotaria magnacalcarata]